MLRKYQSKLVDAVTESLEAGRSVVLQLPTGGGKTKIATEIVSSHDGIVWFICHRQEIEKQAAVAFSDAGIDFGIVSPRSKPDYEKRVQIVSVATLARRIDNMPDPSLAIWDECHHVAAKSWARIRAKLGQSSHLGLTATPERLDGKGLSEWFDELIVGPTPRELIDDGWLSDFRYFAPSEPDLAAARIRAGDYQKEDLAKVMNTPVLIGDAMSEYNTKASGKRALVFCASVDASIALVEKFNEAGIPSRHVDGTTSTDDRENAVRMLADGEIKILSNVELFTEGFDLPSIDAVILMRPTKSLALYLQMIGRALRTAGGKDEALIFDHAGLWLDHDWFDIPIEWSLEGGAQKRRLAGRKHGPRRCPECKEVRAVREPICGCGYEFPSGREIGECDGVLHEMRGVAPDGWVSQAEFARNNGVSGFTVTRMIAHGLPTSDCGHIIVDQAMIWLESNWLSPNSRPFGVENPGDYMSQKEFSKLVRRSSSSINNWIKEGMPAAPNGWPKTSAALAWVDRNKPTPPDGAVSISEFAKIVGLEYSLINKLKKRGMPVSGGFVFIEDGMRWLRGYNSPYLRPFAEAHPSSFEMAKNFGIRIGLGRSFFKVYDWKLRGLPCASNGWVHIQRGLEWVRDNTNITIPPEAWPDQPTTKGESIMKTDNTPTLITLNDACAMTSMSRSMLNRYREEGRFPAAVPLGDRRVAFVRSEVMEWVADKIAARVAA